MVHVEKASWDIRFLTRRSRGKDANPFQKLIKHTIIFIHFILITRLLITFVFSNIDVLKQNQSENVILSDVRTENGVVEGRYKEYFFEILTSKYNINSDAKELSQRRLGTKHLLMSKRQKENDRRHKRVVAHRGYLLITGMVKRKNTHVQNDREPMVGVHNDSKNNTIIHTRQQRNSSHGGKGQHGHTNCLFTEHPLFPLCFDQLTRLNNSWAGDNCYTDTHSIDGTPCSLYDYLTKVEPYCLGKRTLYANHRVGDTTMNFDMQGLVNIFAGDTYSWIKERISLLWPTWCEGAKMVAKERKRRQRKKVIVFPASLGIHDFFLRQAGRGGPLGEVIQWTDLTTALYMLGYNVHFVINPTQFSRVIGKRETDCRSGGNEEKIDVIYTDVNGVNFMRDYFGKRSFTRYRCMLRVLDSFGMFPEYNYPDYLFPVPKGRSVWGDLNLIPTQFLTFYPHTHDNSFLGFVIPDPSLTRFNPNQTRNRNQSFTGNKKKGLLYAKKASYVKNHERYLDIVSEYFELHATCQEDHPLPSYVINHGPVPSNDVQTLLSQSDVFIGLGFPYEGPGPLEAHAHGVVYLQPKFNTPIGKMNSLFYVDKPTLRNLSSQNPYMEEVVGPPYCYTIDVTNVSLLRTTLQHIKDMKKPLQRNIPEEFTTKSFMERVHVFTEYMDYCDPYSPRWPPLKNLQIHLSKAGHSCKEVCMKKGLVCERTYFNDINTVSIIEKYVGVKCRDTKWVQALHAPSFHHVSLTCYLQAHQQVFSCMHTASHVARLCPCRDHVRGQTAICKNCL